MESLKTVIAALPLICATEIGCVGSDDNANVASATHEDRKIIYFPDVHVMSDSSDGNAQAMDAQNSQYKVLSEHAGRRDLDLAIVQEGSFREGEEIQPGYNIQYNQQTIDAMFGGDPYKAGWKLSDREWMAVPRVLTEFRGRFKLVGSETLETFQATGKNEALITDLDAVWAQRDEASCPNGSSITLGQAADVFLRNDGRNNSTPHTDCYCAFWADWQTAASAFEEDRFVSAPRREAQAALASDADVTFIVAGSNHYKEIKRVFDSQGVTLEVISYDGFDPDTQKHIPRLDDKAGICAARSPVSTGRR